MYFFYVLTFRLLFSQILTGISGTSPTLFNSIFHLLAVLEMSYNDGLVFYYFNASGTKGGTPAIKAMLNYLRNSCESNVINNDIRKLHQYVSQVKLQPEVRDEYMHLDELIAWHRRDEGRDTTIENIFDLLSDYGEIPEDLKEHITDQKDISVLRHWHKLAARSASIEEFRQKIL